MKRKINVIEDKTIKKPLFYLVEEVIEKVNLQIVNKISYSTLDVNYLHVIVIGEYEQLWLWGDGRLSVNRIDNNISSIKNKKIAEDALNVFFNNIPNKSWKHYVDALIREQYFKSYTWMQGWEEKDVLIPFKYFFFGMKDGKYFIKGRELLKDVKGMDQYVICGNFMNKLSLIILSKEKGECFIERFKNQVCNAISELENRFKSIQSF